MQNLCVSWQWRKAKLTRLASEVFMNTLSSPQLEESNFYLSVPSSFFPGMMLNLRSLKARDEHGNRVTLQTETKGEMCVSAAFSSIICPGNFKCPNSKRSALETCGRQSHGKGGYFVLRKPVTGVTTKAWPSGPESQGTEDGRCQRSRLFSVCKQHTGQALRVRKFAKSEGWRTLLWNFMFSNSES